uniref:Putative tail protein n=1 Tax=viral metagenome TaxID=1070528 RepID=A0A6M3IJP9_9ZZZZ
MSLRDKIKEVKDIKEEIVFVADWDARISVRSMSGVERAMALNESLDDAGKVKNDVINAALLIACCYDPDTNEKLFTSDDKEWLMQKNASAIELLVTKAMEVSGLSGNSVKTAEKN